MSKAPFMARFGEHYDGAYPSKGSGEYDGETQIYCQDEKEPTVCPTPSGPNADKGHIDDQKRCD